MGALNREAFVLPTEGAGAANLGPEMNFLAVGGQAEAPS